MAPRKSYFRGKCCDAEITKTGQVPTSLTVLSRGGRYSQKSWCLLTEKYVTESTIEYWRLSVTGKEPTIWKKTSPSEILILSLRRTFTQQKIFLAVGMFKQQETIWDKNKSQNTFQLRRAVAFYHNEDNVHKIKKSGLKQCIKI